MNETVLAKLLKLGYIRFIMRQHASIQEYTILLTCLLRRPHQAPNLTLQVLKKNEEKKPKMKVA